MQKRMVWFLTNATPSNIMARYSRYSSCMQTNTLDASSKGAASNEVVFGVLTRATLSIIGSIPPQLSKNVLKLALLLSHAKNFPSLSPRKIKNKGTVIHRPTLPRFTRIRRYAVFLFDHRAHQRVRFTTSSNVFRVE